MSVERNKGVFIEGREDRTEALPGETAGELLLRQGIYIDQPCGGGGLCGKCRIILSGVLPEPTAKEKKIFSEAELASGLRLACQTKASDGMNITIPVQDSRQIKVLDSFEKGRSSAFPCSAAEGSGIAADIGTTTIVVYLIDLATGMTVAAASGINPQTSFGADVISRISYIGNDPARLAELQKAVITQINILIDEVFSKSGRKPSGKDIMAAAGNTTMEHIFAGVSPESIGRAPFKPRFCDSLELQALELGIKAERGVKVRLLPNIYGFIGGDIVSGIIYTGMHKRKELSLLVDIGTNNEMVLGNSDFILCCSAAAGPALEGAKIKMGMRAAPGAIDSVKINSSGVQITTIGGVPPIGICGSGIIDAASVLLSAGVITESGRFADKKRITEHLAEKFKGEKGKDLSFILASEGEYGQNPEISLTQKDIREIQLAKGAIAAGTEILLENSGKKLEDIQNVYLAGAFGNYIDIENAVTVSILPDVPREKIRPVGNSAGAGACLLLKDPSLWETAAGIIKRAQHIELAEHRKFQEIFVNNLSFKKGGIKNG
ncbi:MAG: ASKHA domain-containing protein [Synergistaceae bacterium]|nr:ASKHA domain-containing protein [Synergistaceae bacterium]